MSEIEITEEEWVTRYRPIGDDMLNEPPDCDARYVWTEVDPIDGDGYLILPGFHHLNRIGYWQCEVPWDADKMECCRYGTRAERIEDGDDVDDDEDEDE